MEKILFIDANIYLRFYDTNSSQFKTLLKSIEEIKDDIFVTRQIENEVNRNKLDVFQSTCNSYITKFSIAKITLPEHLKPVSDKELKDWNLKTEKIEKETNEHKKELRKIISKLIESVCINADEVSIVLQRIFDKSEDSSEDQKTRARHRKEFGNPPGKKGDPLGDQLSWEQLLTKIPELKDIWIVSNDRDYMIEFEEKCYLNPFLLKEIKKMNADIKVNCFNIMIPENRTGS